MPIDHPLPAAHNPRSRFSLVVTIVGLAGVAAIFLPFSSGTSLLEEIRTLPFLGRFRSDLVLDGLWRLGVPSLLAPLVTAGTIRWVISGRLSRAERLVSYLAALVAACPILSIYTAGVAVLLSGSGSTDVEPSRAIDWVMFAFPWSGLSAGAYLVRRNMRTGVPDSANAVGAMQVVYVVVALFSLVGFVSDGWQVGAYLVAVTTAVYLTQIVAVSVAAPGHMTLAQK